MNDLPTYPSLWNLAENPVFRRHMVARLRPVRIAVWVLISQVVTGFVWFAGLLIYLNVHSRHVGIGIDLRSEEFRSLMAAHGTNACLAAWIPVLVIQGVLVILKGTFSVATGIAREAGEGMVDALRLTPLPTGHKVLGQLLGLPVLENLVSILLIPWALLGVWLGGIPLLLIFKVYVIFATSALMHHAIGLVAGTLIRQKILAGTLSQLFVLSLHFVLPAFGGFGIGMISHLGMEPAIMQEMVHGVPSATAAGGIFSRVSILSGVRFFDWEFGLAGYHWIITLSGLFALIAILVRRWNDPRSQLLGKIGTVIFASWVLLLTCGELIPVFADGGVPSEALRRFVSSKFVLQGFTAIIPGLLWVTGFGVTLGWFNLFMVSSIVPSLEARMRSGRTPWWDDGREAMPWVLAISLAFAGAWILVIRAFIHGAGAMPSLALDGSEMGYLAAAMIAPATAWCALLLWKGWRSSLIIGFVMGILPMMAASIGLLVDASPDGWPKWVAGISGLVLPGFASTWWMRDMTHTTSAAVLQSSIILHSLAAIIFFVKARQSFAAAKKDQELKSTTNNHR